MSDTRYDPLAAAPPVDYSDAPVPNGHLSSTLDDLRAAVAATDEVAETEFPDLPLYGPGRHLRFICSTELEAPDWKRMQIASLPQAQRKKRVPDLRKLDEVMMYALLIAEQCTEIAVLQDDGSYRPMAGTFADAELLATLGATDASVAVHRVLGKRDAYVLRAGEELINACGYGERKPGDPRDDDEDPT
ncbi:MAG TPA: hypothetical protein VE155_12695 [Pseudonocardiaceae bacterium]|jgi:hypothetical protein|nr:hypothetical protein [Pseudonocardiaceae bacterium]